MNQDSVPLPRLLINLAMYQVGWFVCVLTPSSGLPWLGVVGVAILLSIHAVLWRPQAAEWKFIACAGLIGLLADSLVAATGAYRFVEAGTIVSWMTPPWLVALWLSFGTTFNHSLKAIGNHWWMAAILGFLGGPLAYWAGGRLGALEFASGQTVLVSLLIVGIQWAVITPLFFFLLKLFQTNQR